MFGLTIVRQRTLERLEADRDALLRETKELAGEVGRVTGERDYAREELELARKLHADTREALDQARRELALALELAQRARDAEAAPPAIGAAAALPLPPAIVAACERYSFQDKQQLAVNLAHASHWVNLGKSEDFILEQLANGEGAR